MLHLISVWKFQTVIHAAVHMKLDLQGSPPHCHYHLKQMYTYINTQQIWRNILFNKDNRQLIELFQYSCITPQICTTENNNNS